MEAVNVPAFHPNFLNITFYTLGKNMLKNEISAWLYQEFQPIELATPNETVIQIIDNALRYWNTHSALPLVKMADVSQSVVKVQLTPDYKSVVKVYPATVPDWVLQNFPMWSLLGITIIDNLTQDLVMLSEAYRNYKYYIGSDFNWTFNRSYDPKIGGSLFMQQIPSPTTAICVVGTKRILNGPLQINIMGTSGTFEFYPFDAGTVTLTNGAHTYTDDGDGILESDQSGYSGTVNYDTGAWTITGWVDNNMVATAEYVYWEDVKSEHILQWLLYYVKALVKMVEGNALRKTMAIDIKNDGQQMYDEGKVEKKELEDKLLAEGRWLTFARRF